ncbi:MAG TPA: 3-dehydroquinate synthase, partial [Saprospiraceae bacterium]|nr:3-dehydroquinate synthase [Saprospiraceae bacterium]
MHTVFDLPHYPVHVGDIASSLPRWLQQQRYSAVWVLTDENTHAQCWPLFREKTGLEQAQVFAIPAGEGHKNLTTCEQLWAAWLHARLDRGALVINLGGGVVGDLGGFCA